VMKVILLKDVNGLGKAGNVVNASDGHARNYLIPRGMAKEATEGGIKSIQLQKASEEKRKQNEVAKAQALADKISGLTVLLKGKAGEGRKLFGSITSKDIAAAMTNQHKIDLDKRKIQLENPIKELGTTIVEIKIYHEITAKLKVEVVAE